MITGFLETSRVKLASVGAAMVYLISASCVQATDSEYVNDGVVNVTIPPYSDPIDATNFINNGTFSAFGFSSPYQTFNTENFTNRGAMDSFSGFDFQTHPDPTGSTRLARNFYNEGSLFAYGKVLIGATNVLVGSPNTIPDGLFQITGYSVDAILSLITMGTQVDGAGTPQTIYWGIGTNEMNPANLENEAVTPLHDVTYAIGTTGVVSLVLPLADSYVYDDTVESNRTVKVAFVEDSSVGVSYNVYFTDTDIIVEWVWETVNPFTLETTTNYMYLRDDFGSTTNLAVFPTNGTPRQPVNYTLFSTTLPDTSLPSPAGITPPIGVFEAGTVSNDYAAFSVDITAATAPISPVGGIELLPNRVEIEARETLNLELARIGVPNYLSLQATNHFEGASGAMILSVYSDLDLATTNGLLSITNLLLPDMPRLVGSMQMYSARWETETDGITNKFHVLFVESSLTNGTPTLIEDLSLSSSHAVVISDELNVYGDTEIKAKSLTLTANGAGSFSSSGALNFLGPGIIGASMLPSLQHLTNHGVISMQNAAFFGSDANPYQDFVNTGAITNQGTLIWADRFENQGIVDTGLGSLTATFGSAILTNGSFVVFQGDIRLTGESLEVGNQELQAGRELRLDISGNLNDGGGLTSTNQWSAGEGLAGGVRLLQRPAAGDLLGTTIRVPFEDPASSQRTPIVWAGEDKGCDSSGFDENAALKELVLDAGSNSRFEFSGVDTNSALYVETLTLENFATNVVQAIKISTNFRLYYAQAFADGTDVSEALNGTLSGRLCWVSNYVGAFSSVAIEYSESETVVMNAALAASSVIDSDADGIVNSLDSTPVYTGSQVGLQLGLTTTAPEKPLLSWSTLPGAENVVLYKDSWSEPEWHTLTSFTSTSNKASFVDQSTTGRSRLYQIRVNP